MLMLGNQIKSHWPVRVSENDETTRNVLSGLIMAGLKKTLNHSYWVIYKLEFLTPQITIFLIFIILS